MIRSECLYHCRKDSFFIFPFQPSKPGSLGFVQTMLDKILKFSEKIHSIFADMLASQKQ